VKVDNYFWVGGGGQTRPTIGSRQNLMTTFTLVSSFFIYLLLLSPPPSHSSYFFDSSKAEISSPPARSPSLKSPSGISVTWTFTALIMELHKLYMYVPCTLFDVGVVEKVVERRKKYTVSMIKNLGIG
jgi:hypothetical protein